MIIFKLRENFYGTSHLRTNFCPDVYFLPFIKLVPLLQSLFDRPFNFIMWSGQGAEDILRKLRTFLVRRNTSLLGLVNGKQFITLDSISLFSVGNGICRRFIRFIVLRTLGWSSPSPIDLKASSAPWNATVTFRVSPNELYVFAKSFNIIPVLSAVESLFRSLASIISACEWQYKAARYSLEIYWYERPSALKLSAIFGWFWPCMLVMLSISSM